MSALNQRDLVVNPAQVAWLVEQGRRGIHPLFRLDTIRDGLESAPGLVDNDETMIGMLNGTIRNLAGLPDLEAQRRFIEEQPPRVRRLLVRLYFRFLDQFMADAVPTLH